MTAEHLPARYDLLLAAEACLNTPQKLEHGPLSALVSHYQPGGRSADYMSGFVKYGKALTGIEQIRQPGCIITARKEPHLT
jgi:hypothetical protein